MLAFFGYVIGPLAHLVERTHGMGEVAGSSPAWSTSGCSIVVVYTLRECEVRVRFPAARPDTALLAQLARAYASHA